MAAQMLNVDPNEYEIYKADWLDCAGQKLKNDKHSMKKAHVRSGDLLIIKNKKDVKCKFSNSYRKLLTTR